MAERAVTSCIAVTDIPWPKATVAASTRVQLLTGERPRFQWRSILVFAPKPNFDIVVEFFLAWRSEILTDLILLEYLMMSEKQDSRAACAGPVNDPVGSGISRFRSKTGRSPGQRPSKAAAAETAKVEPGSAVRDDVRTPATDFENIGVEAHLVGKRQDLPGFRIHNMAIRPWRLGLDGLLQLRLTRCWMRLSWVRIRFVLSDAVPRRFDTGVKTLPLASAPVSFSGARRSSSYLIPPSSPLASVRQSRSDGPPARR